MATASFPFPYPAPAPAYGHPTAFASPHHTQIHGYCYPPPFPYPVTYPYTHPAAAYAPPPGFFPVPPPGFVPPPAYGAPTACSFAAIYPPLPASAYTPIPTKVEPNWPPPAPDPSPSSLVSAPAHGVFPITATPTSVSELTAPPTRAPISSDRSNATLRLLVAIPSAPTRERRKSQSNAASTSSDDGSATPPSANLSSSKADQGRTFQEDGNAVQRHTTVSEHMAQSQSLFDSLQAELSKMRDRLASLANSMVSSSSLSSTTTGHTTSVVFTPASESTTKVLEEMPTTTSAPSFGFTPSSGSKATASTTVTATATSAYTVPSATAYDTQVFGEMPTPKSCPRKCSSALHYYREQGTPVLSTLVLGRNSNLTKLHLDEMPAPNYLQETHGTVPRHHNPSQNSCVSTNLNEQQLDVRPQHYGLQSLSRQSIVLSDDSEHSYYALPEKYNLEQAASEPVFDVYADEKDGSSTDFVYVLASLQEQHTYEDQQTYGSIEYSHSNNEIELPSVTNSELCSELGKAQVHNHEWNMLLTEKREEWDPGIRKTLMDISQVAKSSSFTLVSSPLSMLWDPGASLPLMSSKTQQSSQALQPATHATVLAASSVTHFSGCKCLPFWVKNNIYVLCMCCREIRDNCFADLELMANTSSKVATSTGHGSLPWDPGSAVHWYDTLWLTKLIARHNHAARIVTVYIQYMATSCSNSVLHATHFILRKVAHLTQADYLCSLYCNSVLKTSYIWDPGIESILFLYKGLYVCEIQLVHCSATTENYKAKHLLLSSKDLQIWDIGTFFTTFLPP